MLVSMRAATLVKILSLPPPASSLLLFQTARSPVPRCSLIEHAQPRFRVGRRRMCTGWNDVNYLARLDPFNFIARLKTVLFGDSSGYSDLVFRCDFCHFLTLTRTLSLLQLLNHLDLDARSERPPANAAIVFSRGLLSGENDGGLFV